MTTQRERLQQWLRTSVSLSDNLPQSALFTGFLVSGIRDSADLWQEAQDAYGEGADGLMQLLARYAQLASAIYDRLPTTEFCEVFEKRESSVETYFLWHVLEPFGEALANRLKEIETYFLREEGENLLFDMVTDWLLGPEKQLGPSENDRWIIDAGREEFFYSKCETMQEAIADCMDYYGLVSDSGIRKVERIG